MTHSQLLSSRFREVALNGKWIANTNFKEVIENVPWEQAVYSYQDLNSIALLTFHVSYYIQGVNHVFEGGNLEIRDKYSFDMPIISGESDWKELKTKFVEDAIKFVDHVEKMEDQQLDEPFAHEKYGTYRRNIEAMIEHLYYHLGQIVLIRKLVQ